MKQSEKNVRLVSVESDGSEYRKDNGLLCVIRVSVEAERPKDFDKLPLRIRARYAHAKGQNVAKYFFISEFIAEIQYLLENGTEEFAKEEIEKLQKIHDVLESIDGSDSSENDAKAGKAIEKYLREFSCNDNGTLPIFLATAPISEVLKGTQHDGTTSVIVESNGNEVTLNEMTDFNFIENDNEAEISYLRNSLLQQIANGDAVPNGQKQAANATAKSEVTKTDDLDF